MVPVFFVHNVVAVVRYMQIFHHHQCLVKPAMKTGNVDLITNAMAREVLTNKEGLATGVSYVNKDDMQEYQVKGRVSYSCCQCL